MLNLWSTGTIFFIPAGNDPTPVKVGGLQDITTTFKTGVKPVGSQYRHAIKFTVDNCSITAVAKQAKIDGAMFAQIVYGKSWSQGSRKVIVDQEATVPGGLAVTPSFTGTYVLNLGVVDAATGLPMTCVASSPGAGEYSVSAGTYRFASAGGKVRISMAYDSTDGKSLDLTNEVFQFAPTFAVMLSTEFNCKQVGFWLPYAVSEQLVIPARLEQYAIPEFSFQAQMAPNLSMGLFSFGE